MRWRYAQLESGSRSDDKFGLFPAYRNGSPWALASTLSLPRTLVKLCGKKKKKNVICLLKTRSQDSFLFVLIFIQSSLTCTEIQIVKAQSLLRQNENQGKTEK